MKTADMIFLDTNLLVYASQAESPFHASSRAVIEKGMMGDLSLCISPQVLAEFYSTITSPKRVTDPISHDQAVTEMKKYMSSKRIAKIFAHKAALDKMLRLLEKYPVKQQEIFDLQLVATMVSNGVTRIYTYNEDDFKRFTEIAVLHP